MLLSSATKIELNLELFGYQLKPYISPSIGAGCHSDFRRNSPGLYSTQKEYCVVRVMELEL